MQNVIDNIFSKIFIFITGLILAGCASDPVPTYLPASSPAHPEATEVVYTAKPNPFHDNMSMTKMESDEAPHTPPKAHGGPNTHRMKSDDNKPKNSVGTKTEKAGHQHKEHE